MPWYDGYRGGTEKPLELDTTSSHKWNYIRKDIVFVKGDGELIDDHWEFKEQKIKKDDWDIYQKTFSHDSALDDIYAALTELAELIVEEG